MSCSCRVARAFFIVDVVRWYGVHCCALPSRGSVAGGVPLVWRQGSCFKNCLCACVFDYGFWLSWSTCRKYTVSCTPTTHSQHFTCTQVHNTRTQHPHGHNTRAQHPHYPPTHTYIHKQYSRTADQTQTHTHDQHSAITHNTHNTHITQTHRSRWHSNNSHTHHSPHIHAQHSHAHNSHSQTTTQD